MAAQSPVKLNFSLHPRQVEAFNSTATEILYGGSAGGGKLLPLTERLPTPTGWVSMGDVRVGQELFDENGEVCRVIALSQIEHEPELWEFVFDDGSRITSCEDHQWITYDEKQLLSLTRKDPEWRAARRARRPSRANGIKSACFRDSISRRNTERAESTIITLPNGSVRTTRDIVGSLRTSRGRANHAIPVQTGIKMDWIRLPIDPYVLGSWLGDGSSNGGGFTGVDPDIWEIIEAVGYEMSHRGDGKTHHILGLSPQLRNSGVLNNKHIPQIYFRASREQRLELLRGLMDTDGTVHKPSFMPEFCNTNKAIVDGIRELIVSLGWKCYVREGRAKLNGRDCGPKWTVKFAPDEKVFNLPRKADIQKLASRRTTRFRYIMEANKVPSVPGRCIQVDSPRSLYLAGDHFIPTHNSHLMRVMAVSACLEVPGLQVYLFRRQSTDLIKNHVEGPTGFPILIAPLIKADYAKITHNPNVEMAFKNGPMGGYEGGSKIFVCHCKEESNKYNYLGAEIHMLIADELTTFTESIYRFLRGRVRLGGLPIPPHVPKGKYPRIICGSNPGGVGHYFVKYGFIDGHAPMEVWRTPKKEGGLLRQYIPARLDDNPTLLDNDPDYADRLHGLGNDALVQAMLNGDWDVFQGQAFPFSQNNHVVQPMPVPPNAQIYFTFDWGYSAPFSCGWWWVDGDGRIYRFAEWYGWNGTPGQGLRITDTEIALGIKEREDRLGISGRSIIRMSGPDCFSKKPDYMGGGQGPSTSEMFGRQGIFLTPGDADRKKKIRQFYERLRVPKDGTAPMLQVYPSCTQFIRTIPTLVMDDNNVEELATHLEDHVYDEACHVCMARPVEMDLPGGKKTFEAKLIEAFETASPASDVQSVAGYYGEEMAVDTISQLFEGGQPWNMEW